AKGPAGRAGPCPCLRRRAHGRPADASELKPHPDVTEDHPRPFHPGRRLVVRRPVVGVDVGEDHPGTGRQRADLPQAGDHLPHVVERHVVTGRPVSGKAGGRVEDHRVQLPPFQELPRLFRRGPAAKAEKDPPPGRSSIRELNETSPGTGWLAGIAVNRYEPTAKDWPARTGQSAMRSASGVLPRSEAATSSSSFSEP